jgi:polyhydroxyalkanoate synthesis repressor PhaR
MVWIGTTCASLLPCRNLRLTGRAEHITHRVRMGPAVTAAPERHLIKKYANRKLYDTRTSRYITLEGIAELVRDGHEIKVVDRSNGHDLTQVTLSQIVLSREKRGPGEAIQEGGQTLLDYVRRTLNVPSDIRHQMEKRREDLEERADETIERALQRLRIPTHTDIDRINARLDRISAQLKTIGVDPATKKSNKRRAAR